VNAAAEDIAAGRHDAVLIGGAEAWRSRMRLRAEGQRPDWTRQDESVTPPELLIPDVPMIFENQQRTGLDRPARGSPSNRSSAGRRLAVTAGYTGFLWLVTSANVSHPRPSTPLRPKLLGDGMSNAALTWAFASSVVKSSGYTADQRKLDHGI
jgi:hypothetical protein